jgi:thiol-disulfide isomerase/thioredoxin
MDDPNTVTLFLEPTTMKVVVEEDKFKQAQVTGSQTQKEYAQLQASFIQLRNRWKTVMDTLSAVNKRSNFQYQEMKDWVLTPYTAEMDEIENDFFKHHPGSYVTAYYLRFKSRELSRDSLLVFYQKMPEKVKQSSFGKALFTEIEKKKIGVPGTEAKMFSSIDIDGKPLNLSDFKGKYVLVDFWASWCVPCRKGNPHLKELYATYKGKGFEVIGVSDDDRYPNAWKKAVAQDGLPWKHVLRGLKSTNGVFDRTNDISEDFNISSLPTQILIDPSGKIIGRYGDGGQPHNWLDSMLQSVFH